MSDHEPSEEWIEAANCLATVAHQLSSALHEANNLLQVIAGSAEMIQFKPDLPDDVRKRTEVIAEHAHRVSAMLGGARELVKFQPPLEGQTTDMRVMVQRALDLRKHSLGRAQLAVSADLGDAPVVARVNARPAIQVVLNLLLNAEQAIRGRQAGRIDIRLVRELDTVTLTVTDNGPGFTPNTETFALGRDSESSPRLGIGLRAAHWMCSREGATLDVTAAEHGTVATLRVPARP
jgi:signal transduction histidine kinase